MTAHDYAKLEKVEFGGVRGKSLNTLTVDMFTEFNDLFAAFGDISDEPLNLDSEVRQHSYF